MVHVVLLAIAFVLLLKLFLATKSCYMYVINLNHFQRMTRRRRMTMKKAKRRMMARKGKKIRTMMTRERDSLTSSNLQRGRTVRKMHPTSSTTSCRTRSSTHCEQIIHLDSIEMEIILIDRNRLDSHLFRQRPTKSS